MYAVNESGYDVGPHDSEACQWCMEGAMLAYAYEHITPNITLDTLEPIRYHDVYMERKHSMAAFNDDDDTTFENAVDMLNMLAGEFYSLVEQERTMLSKYEIHLYDNNVLTYTTDYQCKTDKGALNYAIRWARSVCVEPLNTRRNKWSRSPLGYGHMSDNLTVATLWYIGKQA